MDTQRLKLAVIAATVATMVLAGASDSVLAVGDESKISSNPMSGDKDAEKAGRTVYRAKCAYCHGLTANGRGRGLPNAADLRKYKKGYTHFVKTIKEGYKTMPPWGAAGEINDEEIAQVGAYIETLASSPLKKALLTGFHSTAKHNATKAVSPSSETMRTI